MSRARPIAAWPRALHAQRAADYAGYPSERAFRLAVADGSMPPPFELGGAECWDITELDEAIDALKAGGRRAGSWREKAYARSRERHVAGRQARPS